MMTVLGCASTRQTPFHDSPELPPTEADPITYRPTPGESRPASSTVALVLEDRYSLEKKELLQFLLAVRQGDGYLLSRILSDPIRRISGENVGETIRRDELVDQVLRNPYRASLPPQVDLDQLIDSSQIEIIKPGTANNGPTDEVELRFLLRATGQAYFRQLFGWRDQGIVRMQSEREGAIVAL